MALRSVSEKPTNVANATQMSSALLDVFNGLCNGTVEVKRAVEINNTAGKAITLNKGILGYCIKRDEIPKIPFFGDGVEIEKKPK